MKSDKCFLKRENDTDLSSTIWWNSNAYKGPQNLRTAKGKVFFDYLWYESTKNGLRAVIHIKKRPVGMLWRNIFKYHILFYVTRVQDQDVTKEKGGSMSP